MSGSQTVVGALGVGLIGANFWTEQRADVAAGAFSKNATAAQTATAHATLKIIAAELLAVGVATILAGLSPSAGGAMVAILLALALVWAIKHFAPGG